MANEPKIWARVQPTKIFANSVHVFINSLPISMLIYHTMKRFSAHLLSWSIRFSAPGNFLILTSSMSYLIPYRMPTTSQSWSDHSAPACLSPPHAPQHLLSSRLRALRRRCTPAESNLPTITIPALLLTAPWTSRTTLRALSGRLIMTSWPSPWTPITCTVSKVQVQTQAASALWAQPFQRKTSATILWGTGGPNSRALRSCIEGLRWDLQTQMSCRATATVGAGALSSSSSSMKASEIYWVQATTCYMEWIPSLAALPAKL